MIPTVGVYPIATANDKDQISAPSDVTFCSDRYPGLYTGREERSSSPNLHCQRVLKRMSLKEEECMMTDEALDAVIELL